MNILGFPVQVIEGISSDENWGEFNGYVSHGVIHVRQDLSKKEKQHVLLHEVIHAILHFSGTNKMLTEHQEEVITTALANGLSSAGYCLRQSRN